MRQGRQLRLKAVDDKFLETLNELGVTNFKMETSGFMVCLNFRTQSSYH